MNNYDYILENPKFIKWKQRVEGNGIVLSNIKILSIIARSPNCIISIFIDCMMTTPEGQTVPRCMLIRGDSVVVVPIIESDDDEIYTLMVEQRRPIDGDFAMEFPGGMLDIGNESPREIALQELKEELDLTVDDRNLKQLGKQPIKVCTSMLDERVYFFYVKLFLPKNILETYQNKTTGCEIDGEYLKIHVINLKEISECNSFSSLVGIKLIEQELGFVF